MVRDNRIKEFVFSSGATARQIDIDSGEVELYSDFPLNGEILSIEYRLAASGNLVLMESGLSDTYSNITAKSGTSFNVDYVRIQTKDTAGANIANDYVTPVINAPLKVTISGTNISGTTAGVQVRYR